VTGALPGTLSLLHFDGKKCFIAPQIQIGLTTYVAPFLDSSVLRATRFPSGAAEYGDTETLFWKVAGLFRQYLRFSEELAAFATLVVFGTWFADCYPSPITLFVTGSDLRQAMRLLQLFGIFCRRRLTVAGFSRQLPIHLHPTLLLVELAMSKKGRSFWRATKGMAVPFTLIFLDQNENEIRHEAKLYVDWTRRREREVARQNSSLYEPVERAATIDPRLRPNINRGRAPDPVPSSCSPYKRAARDGSDAASEASSYLRNALIQLVKDGGGTRP
jgi:hypothetical protein